MKMSCRMILLGIFCLLLGSAGSAWAAAAPSEQWDSLLEVTYKFSWYPRQDLQKLLEVKTAEHGQSLEEYRAMLLQEVTGGKPATVRIAPGDFTTGLPWRKYYRLSLAEFCLFLTNDREIHLQNAQAALSVLAQKTEQPEIEFWNYVYGAHDACLKKDRQALISSVYSLWQNVILRFELETLFFPSETVQAGFVRNLPFLYENVAHLVIRKAILDKELPALYPLSAVIQDIQPKLTVENGYRTMVDQVVERMRGVNSDNGNINYAVALLEATANRYNFEDEKNEALLGPKYNLTRKYYQLAFDWADSSQGKGAILTEQMGFMNYIIRRFSYRDDMLSSQQFFSNLPALANDRMEQAIAFFDQLAAPAVQNGGFQTEGFADRKLYLKGMHQLWDSTAKLAVVLADYYKGDRSSEQTANVFPAARPLQQYCALFARHARSNADIVPDNAYFLASYAARELAGLFRENAQFSTDNRASALAFAYQLQATEIFPLDVPGILQLAHQSTADGRVRDYFHFATPLAARLRVSNGAGSWPARNPTDFDTLVALVPTVVPEVLENAFVLLRYVPEGETSEDGLFSRAVLLSQALAVLREKQPQEKIDELLTAVGRQDTEGALADPAAGDLRLLLEGGGTYPYFELKSQLYGSPDSPIHGYLRALYHEIPYENHQYVVLLQSLR